MANSSRKQPKNSARVARRAPILVMGCSLLIACCIAFGGSNWVSAPALADTDSSGAPNTSNVADAGVYHEVIGSYEAISQSESEDRAINLKLAAEAINGYVIEPGATFSFNEVVGETSPERGYKAAPVMYSTGVMQGDGGGVCQVSTALYIAAIRANMEIVERHPHSMPSDYAPIGLDATIVYGQRDLQLKNTSDYPITIYAKAVGQTVSVSLLGKPLPEGITIDATSNIVDRYERTASDGTVKKYYVSESFRINYENGIRTTRDLLSSDIYEVDEATSVTLAEGSVNPNK